MPKLEEGQAAAKSPPLLKRTGSAVPARVTARLTALPSALGLRPARPLKLASSFSSATTTPAGGRGAVRSGVEWGGLQRLVHHMANGRARLRGPLRVSSSAQQLAPGSAPATSTSSEVPVRARSARSWASVRRSAMLHKGAWKQGEAAAGVDGNEASTEGGWARAAAAAARQCGAQGRWQASPDPLSHGDRIATHSRGRQGRQAGE